MIETLQDFFRAMDETVAHRRALVRALLKAEAPYSPPLTGMGGRLDSLKRALDELESLPTDQSADTSAENNLRRVRYGEEREILIEVTYEIEELKKDVAFLEEGESAFYRYLDDYHGGILEEVDTALGDLKELKCRCFTTDRDGTVNNYCGRYRSSVQSAYNGLFLSRFARREPENAVLLTSAPLADTGLVDLSVMPEGDYIYAGSKGREYLDSSGEIHTFPIDTGQKQALDVLNRRLQALLSEGAYEIHGLIGSGLQFKFGQTTVSRQDIHHSIPDQQSELFLNLVRSIVREIDPDERIFRIEDTGLDIEIILTISDDSSSGGLRDFDKGDGIRYLDSELTLSLAGGGNLICGDTASDIPMARAAVEESPESAAIFVTRDEKMRASVRAACPRSLFMSSPDVLVLFLNERGKRGR